MAFIVEKDESLTTNIDIILGFVNKRVALIARDVCEKVNILEI